MIKTTHDPEECIRNIFQLLVYKKKRIGFLFGAGTSKAVKEKGLSLSIPDINELTNIIENEILNDKIKTVMNSRSWKITNPLRKLKSYFR